MRFQTTSICVLLMALTISSGYEVIPGREPNHVHDVCSTWGHFHYKTFDGDFYQFPGLCTYNLASDYRNHEFSVHIKRSTDTGQPLIKKIIATIKDIVIQMNSSSILVNEIEAELPYNNFGIFVEDTDVYLKMSTKIGLTLMWNKEDAIMLELQTKFRNVTRGLCGDYNGVPIYNEFITGGNRLTPSDFGNQQNVDDPSETCKNVDSTKMNDALNCSEYRSVCEQNLGHSAFSECIDILDTESYIQACMLDMCSCNQSQIQDMSCLCSTVTEYSRQCSHAGGKPGNWRTDSLCHKQCPLNMVFQESTSPCMSTCSHLAFPTLCTEHNIDGCFCPDGTVYDDYKRAGCVPISECSCISEGILYSTGQTMQRGCQKCHCISGTWSCIKQDCPGVCSIEGGAHFTTFDGKKYTFHGNCLYVLSKGIGVESYNIIGELSMCSYPQRATCLKSIILRDNATNTITFQANGHVLFNDQRITLPYITGGFSIIQPSDFYIIVQSTLGLQMQMQLFTNNMQLYISLDKSVKGNLQGLCGDFNSNANDDFVTYGGLVEATASAFANTWKADDMCPDQKEIHEDPCSLSIENKNYAEHWCSFLENKYSIFAKCHSAVPPQEYAKQCRYDSCNCKDSEPCMCAALSSYVQACAANGIILRDWKIGICDKYVSSCPLSQVYRYDITKRQPKCNSLAERGKVEDIEFIPVDGCGCPAGKYLNEKNQCVSISECSCYENGIYTNPLGIIMKGDQFCSCHNGKLACNTTSNRYQTCSPGKVYFDCNTQLETYTASVYRTCKTLGVENMKCSSGCVCPNELLDDGLGGCVPKDRCSCPHNNDMIPHGKTIKQDCNTCLCQSGHWNCTRYECYGTCTVYGSGHYITFDTRFYEFDGNCEFELAQDYCGNDFSQGSFRVITENIPCGTTGVTCSKAIRVILGNKELKLAEKHLQETQGEGEKSVQYLTREVGIYLVIEASNGILLIWDRKTSIIIKLPPKFKSKVCGLCGNFDDDSNNDFTTRQMLQVTSITEYGNSWKVNPACPDSVPEIHPCKMASHREAWAMKQCSLIKSDVFKVCHSKVDPAPFYEACVNDACSCDTGGDCECFCTVVAVYAQKCNQAEVCVHWRTPDICPIFCDYYNPDEEACEWHYHACGNHKIQTCQYINNINTNVNITFLEGCYPTCPPDKPIFDEEKKICVTKEECGCYIYNTRYKPNEKVPTNNNCETCICTSQGKRHCYYEESACYCMVNGTRYNQHDIISKKSEAGICIVEICINGSISHNITICTTTTESITTTTAITQSVTSMTVSITPEIPSTTSFTEEATPTSIINTSLLLPTSTPVESTTSSATTTQSITTETTSVTTEIPSTSASTEFTTEETTQTSIVSTVPLSLTSTPMENTTTPITVTQSVTTVTVSETPESSSTTPSITECHDETVCSWSQWFNVTYPDDNGEFETYEAIKKKGYKICEKPSNISCRALSFPLTPLEELDTSVKCDVNFGLICNNAEEEDGHCYNYEIQVYCCEESTCTTTSSPSVTSPTITESVVTTISPTTSSLTQTTMPVITTTEFTTEETTQTSIVSTVPLSPTSTPMESTTTPIIVTQSVTTVTVSETPESSSTTPSITECHDETVCSWSQWFNVTYPDDNGEFETYEAIKKKGYKICEKPSNISCRALSFPLTPLEELDTSVKCDVNFGLICNNAEEEDGHCYNYEIQVYCCEESTCTTTSSPSVTSPTITESVVTTISPTTSSLTQTTMPVITTTEFTTEETTQTSIVSTVPLSPTSTPMESTTTPIIVTQSVTTVTVSETPESSSTTPSITECHDETVCSWSQWFNVTYPDDNGEFETYEAIKKKGYKICEKPSNISCRALSFPLTPLEELDTSVKCDVNFGLICNNAEEEDGHCYNYEIQVYCCEESTCTTTSSPSVTSPTITESVVTTISPTTSSLTQTTMPVITTTEFTTEETTQTSIVSTVPLSPTSTPMESTTTPIIVTQSVTTVTVSETPESSSTTPSITECHDETVCSWSQWFNVTYPDDNGEFETYEAIKKKGYKICEKPSNISCRALSFPLTPLEELDTSVKCDVNFGLICNNAEEEDGHCYNYEIQVYCCEESTCTTTSSPSVTSPTITESVVTTISPTTTSLTQTTTPVITTTEFTTEETTQTSIVSTVPLSPTSTPMESTTTPIIVTQSVTTVTVSETPESSSTTPSITPCTPGKICNWSEWINVSSPKPDGDEYETYEEIRKNGYKICEKPENISCRSIKYPDNSMDSQNLTCDVQTGLTCYNKDQEGLQSFPICEDHEIRVYCCEEIICPIFSTPSTTITETFYTTITMATTQIHPTTEQTTEEITSTTTEATSTIPHTMSTEPPVWIRTFTTMIPTVTEQPQQNQTHETTTVLIPSVTSTTPEQTTSETSLSETTSIVTTEPPTSIPEFTISTLCHCLFDGKLYPPGVTITDGAANRTLCYTVICKDDCTLYIHQWSCETPTTPEVTSTTTISESTTTMTTELTSTSELTTPEKTTHSPESTLESTTTIQLISSRTTIPEYTTSNITEGCLLDPPRKHGEVWKLYNCTMARCLENKTIEIFKTQCVTPPPIKCVNGFSPDLVPDADGCCQHWECRCVCLGWGDPHYKTFDGTSYAYQGSCTYVLVEEINKKIPNFGIYIDNYECGNQVSCPRSIIVHYEDQKIQIKVISIPPPVLEVTVNGQLVGLPYNKEAIKIFVSGIFTRVYILTLNATISFSGVDYRVELPYQRFSNNTQGQCGTCTNNKTDDCMLPDGKIISNCEIMAASWIVNTTDKPGCLPIPPSTPTPPPTCIPSPLCELIKGPTFQECHNKLNPDDYYKACIFDSCRAPNISIECSSLQRYASLCIDEGICIDWRSKAPACRISCPSPKVYQPCGPAVTYTCKTTPEEKEANTNNTSMVEGCFCPNGTMLFSNTIDICTKECGCIGLDNIPRKFGERFQLDCHDCICLEGGRGISCEKHQCPDMTNTCPLEGFYPVTQISSSDKCCNETKCYCDTSRCSNNIPNCTLGYEAKSVTPTGHCCPKYECVPKHVCVHENAEYQPGSQVYSGKCETCDCPIHGNISENIKIICHPVHCDLHCLAGYTLDYNSGDCCPRCIQTHCVLNDDGSTHLLKPGEILNKKNDNCTVYNCSENFILTSSNIICQEFFEADCEPGTIQYLPDGCCKTCERKNNSCTLQLSEDYLTYNNCRSLEKVQMSQCEGFCETFSKYSADAKSMQHKCSCCKEVRTSQKEVKMQCKDGSEVPYNYTYVEECNCVTNACDRVQSKRDTYRKEKRPKKTTLNV